MIPWTGTYAWISCRVAEWDLGPSASSDSTGIDYIWYRTQGYTMGRILSNYGGGTTLVLVSGIESGRTGRVLKGGAKPWQFFTWMMAWSHQQTRIICRGC